MQPADLKQVIFYLYCLNIIEEIVFEIENRTEIFISTGFGVYLGLPVSPNTTVHIPHSTAQPIRELQYNQMFSLETNTIKHLRILNIHKVAIFRIKKLSID